MGHIFLYLIFANYGNIDSPTFVQSAILCKFSIVE